MLRNPVVTGVGLVSVLGSDPEVLLDPDKTPIRWDAELISAAHVVDMEPSRFFSAKSTRRVEKYGLFVMVAAARALRSAELLDPDSRSPDRIGLLLSTDYGPSDTVTRYMKQLLAGGVESVSPNLFSQTVMNVALGYPSVELGLRGVSSLIQGNDSMWFAVRHIQTGQADVVLCGGVDVLNRYTFEAYKAMGLVAQTPSACRPRDNASEGMTMGEGCCLLVLESEEHAISRGCRPLARVAGIGSMSDRSRPLFLGHKDSEGTGIEGAIKRSLTAARSGPEQIDAVFGCANGVVALDIAERAALARSFGEHLVGLPVETIKARTGECFQASWMMTVAQAVLSLDASLVSGMTIDGAPIIARANPHIVLCNGVSTNGANTSAVLEAWSTR